MTTNLTELLKGIRLWVLSKIPTTLSSFEDDLGDSPTHTHSQYLSEETDPVFTGSAAYNITSGDISNWNGKQNPSTTLSGYGITDAKIESGTITLGSNTITPLTSETLANWAETVTTSAAYILNKPTIPTVPTTLSSFTDDLGSSPVHTHSQYLTSHLDISGKEDTSNKVTSWNTTTTNTNYPSEKLVKDECDNIREVAEGKCKAFVLNYNTPDSANSIFNSQDNFIEWPDEEHLGYIKLLDGTPLLISDIQLGDVIYIVNTDVPDRWFDNGQIGFFKLETAKVPVTDVQMDGTSVISNNVANVRTINGNYNATNNKLATKSDIAAYIPLAGTNSVTGNVTGEIQFNPNIGAYCGDASNLSRIFTQYSSEGTGTNILLLLNYSSTALNMGINLTAGSTATPTSLTVGNASIAMTNGSVTASGGTEVSLSANDRIRLTCSDIGLTGHTTVTGLLTATSNVSAPAFYETSDKRFKNIHGELSLDKAYEVIEKCSTILYDLKTDDSHKEQIGLIAQEVEEFFPEVVNTDDNGIKSIDYSRLTVIIFKVLKDMLNRLNNLELK